MSSVEYASTRLWVHLTAFDRKMETDFFDGPWVPVEAEFLRAVLLDRQRLLDEAVKHEAALREANLKRRLRTATQVHRDIVAAFEKNPTQSVQTLRETVPKAPKKQVYNVLGYLVRQKRLKRTGYGTYERIDEV